ncbi:MAG: oxidoreductase [Bryobacteraceae bacterium]|nr:MAG: oxidoreductase [Bryobacteraceae bacterium]
MRKLRFVMIGAGFWARYQLAGWLETGGAVCTGIYNRTRAKAEALAREFGVEHVYDDPAEMIDKEKPDFVDVLTDVDTHAKFTRLAAGMGYPVVCQKPMAASLADAEDMVRFCRERGVTLAINENWRWQTPIRAFREALHSGVIGEVFRTRITMVSGFPVFQNQPFLAELEQFILTDIGSHLLDTARFLCGEPDLLYCQTKRVHANIRGEDVATVMMRTRAGATVVVEMGYAENYLERDRFPETFLFSEGSLGSLELAPDFWLRTTTKDGTHARRIPPPRYAWANPAYDVVHSSIVPCHENILRGLRGEGEIETSGEDNLKTVRLIFAAYESAARGAAVPV